MDLVEVALASSAISITIARAKATKPLRDWVEERSELFGHLVNCPYCISHWCAIFFVLTYIKFTHPIALIVDTFAIVAIAALVTGAAMKLLHMDERRIEELQDDLSAEEAENVRLRLALDNIANGN